ncbi:MAG: substrate-binding domain-containing protein [Phycisphaerales bacterium]|nr:substrate-binding domain-containing protein [Phycisphaerales bacterium]
MPSISTRSTAAVAAAMLGIAMLLSACGKPAESPAAKGGDQGGAKGDSPAKLRVAVVPKGTTHDFWKSVHAGAKQAEHDLEGVEITFQGPEREDDRAQQIGLVENLIASKYDAIVIAPLDDKALVAPIRAATQAGIPVVVIDSGLDAEVGKDYVSFIATDNEQGGRMGGQKMAELLGGKGRVLLLRYQEGSASTTLREKGFVEAIGEAPGIELVDPKRYAGATRATAQEAAENLLSTYEGIDGIFCPNESSTFGMLLAVRARGWRARSSSSGSTPARGWSRRSRPGTSTAWWCRTRSGWVSWG